ncbi:hypothetical protein UF75_3294 [Desulfosporosinus sp. I2]|nr:hypothetical protein UF75_3294 [Desulfosporosinus sp. I2]
MPPKIAVKVNLPFGYLRLDRNPLIVIFRIFNATVTKFGLQLLDISKGLLHRREQQLLPNGIQHSLLFTRERIVLQEGVKLRLIPTVSLLQCRSIAVSQQEPQEVHKISCHRMHIVSRCIHRADGKHHLAKATHEAIVDTIHTGPADHFRTLGRAEVVAFALATLQANAGAVKIQF